MSPNVWMFVRALELDRQQRAQLAVPPRGRDSTTDAAAPRATPIAFT